MTETKNFIEEISIEKAKSIFQLLLAGLIFGNDQSLTVDQSLDQAEELFTAWEKRYTEKLSKIEAEAETAVNKKAEEILSRVRKAAGKEV